MICRFQPLFFQGGQFKLDRLYWPSGNKQDFLSARFPLGMRHAGQALPLVFLFFYKPSIIARAIEPCFEPRKWINIATNKMGAMEGSSDGTYQKKTSSYYNERGSCVSKMPGDLPLDKLEGPTPLAATMDVQVHMYAFNGLTKLPQKNGLFRDAWTIFRSLRIDQNWMLSAVMRPMDDQKMKHLWLHWSFSRLQWKIKKCQWYNIR